MIACPANGGVALLGARGKFSMLGFWSAHEKRDVIHFVDHLAGGGGSGSDFAGAAGVERLDQLRKHRGWRNGNVVLTEHCFNLGCERCQAPNRSSVGFEVGLGTIKPNRRRIVRVPVKKQAMCAIEQRNSIRRVPGRGDDYERSPAQIDAISVMRVRRDLPGPGRVGFVFKSCWQAAANLIGAQFGLRVFREPRALARVKSVFML